MTTFIAHYSTWQPYLEEIQEIQVQSSVKQHGKSSGDGPDNTPASVTQRTESSHLRPWYKNGSDGQDKNPRAQRWLSSLTSTDEGPACLLLRYFTRIIHILTKLNKQWVPHAEYHISPLYIIAIFTFVCSSSPRLHNGNYSNWKRNTSGCWIQVCCIHKAWMNIAIKTLWFTAFATLLIFFSFHKKLYRDSVPDLNNA